MNKISSYKDLKVWLNGMEIVDNCYQLMASIPNEEVYGLKSQMTRSAISIPSNIAEGWGRNKNKGFLQFLRISRGSLYELETLLIIAKNRNYITTEDYDRIQQKITKESKMLSSIIRKIETKDKFTGH